MTCCFVPSKGVVTGEEGIVSFGVYTVMHAKTNRFVPGYLPGVQSRLAFDCLGVVGELGRACLLYS